MMLYKLNVIRLADGDNMGESHIFSEVYFDKFPNIENAELEIKIKTISFWKAYLWELKCLVLCFH